MHPKKQLREILIQSLEQARSAGELNFQSLPAFEVEAPKQADHGDLATNLAMVVAGKDRKNPRAIAAQLMEMLAPHTDLLDKVEIAGPGFVNCYINQTVWQSVLPEVCARDEAFGRSEIGQGKKVLEPLDLFLYRTIQVGVVLLAGGTMLGAVWANASWGRYWGWDPKEVFALNTWLVFLRFQLMRGVLTREAYQSECELVRATLSKSEAPHWREFLALWK